MVGVVVSWLVPGCCGGKATYTVLVLLDLDGRPILKSPSVHVGIGAGV